MRDPQRIDWEKEPDRPLLQSEGLNRTILIWFLGAPLIVLLLKLLGPFSGFDWKETIAVMMFASASSVVIDVLGWIYERIKYRDR